MMALLLCACSTDEEERTPEDNFSPNNKPTIENTLKFETKELTFTPQKTSGSIHINTNIEYIVELKSENKDWIKYDTNSNKYISFEVRPNNSENERSAKCIISNKEMNISDTLHIKQSINKERLALISIYKALNGDQWVKNENWCSDKPLNEWDGIVSQDDYGVSMISLNNDAFIEGIIPPEIGMLKDLVTLSISNTNLHGYIPSEISNLHKLKYIYLNNNKMTGKLPVDICKCKSLEILDLSNNRFNDTLLLNIPNLKEIYAHDNNLSKIKFENGFCDHISKIYLFNNNISGTFPANVFNKTIEEIYIYGNEITGELPKEIINSINLKYIDVSGNKLLGNLPELSEKSLLRVFNISNNDITGNIPTSYANVKNLSLSIHHNKMKGIIPEEVKRHNNFYKWSINPQREGYSLIY